MSEFPLGYEKIEPATWAYLSSLLMIGLFFKFNRVWSVRNLDLLLLILLAPGLLFIHEAKIRQREIHEERVYALAELKTSRQNEAESTRSEYDPVGEESGEAKSPAKLDPESDPPATRSPEQSKAPSALPEADQESNETSASGNPVGGASEGGASESGASESGAQDESPASEPPPFVEEIGLNEPPAQDSEAKPENAPEARGNSKWTASERAAIEAIEVRRDAAIRFERNGYIFLFAVGGLILIRMLVDPMMVRRPLLEPNLTGAGLTFIGCSLLVFLISNVITSETTRGDLDGAIVAREMVSGAAVGTEEESDQRYKLHGPGYSMLYLLPVIPTVVQNDQPADFGDVPVDHHGANVWTAKVMAIISQLALVIGIAYIGSRHFNHFSMGVGAATLYLMLPYTAMMTGRVTHALPAALIVWAIAFYRRPLVAGSLIGMAMGTVYYPLFLLPLWFSFYWRRGKLRFLIGFLAVVILMGAALAFDASSIQDYFEKLRAMFGAWQPRMNDLHGIWALGWDSIYRLPFLAGFVLLSTTFAFWPAQKNLGTLINCSCAVMVAVQFWHGFGGGLHMAWYLPLLLLAVFRPNLEDRVALTVLDPGWTKSKRRSSSDASGRAVA